MDPTGILLRTQLFGGLTAADLEDLAPDIGERSFDRDQPLWLEGDPALALYVVAEGQVKAHRVGADGSEVILGFYREGDAVGEVGLFHPSGVRRVSTTAMTRAHCLRIPKAPLLRFLTRHPPTMERMLERLSTIAGQAAYSFSGLAFGDIRRRVAVALLSLGEEFGEEVGDRDVRIRLRLSQGTLAALVAASRENVNRALSSLVTNGAVSQRDGHFHLHDLDALRRVAESGPDL